MVGVFGAWRAQEGDPIYSRAMDYGRALALAGHGVLTGGYSGVMEAANRGAAEKCGRSVGVTCPEINCLLPSNPWANELVRAEDLPARLAACFRSIEAAVFLPGRSGTITELAFALEMREKGLLTYPVFLTCNHWDSYLTTHREYSRSLAYPASEEPSELVCHCVSPSALIDRLERKP